MEGKIYQEIAARTAGDIYIGVVGPVRSGKSSFIKQFMETVVIPHMENDFRRDRAIDELPQSAAGKTIMTTEPKFIPEEAVRVDLEGGSRMNVRMIDCVGYIVPSSLGYVENGQPRMVRTPWFEEAIPFNMAAEIGTQKVIKEHSTIGLVITSDGSISDIPREEYEEAEERVIEELRAIDKPFTVLLNCSEPKSRSAQELAKRLQEKYAVPVMAISCLDLGEEEIREILLQVLQEFPIKEICIDLPRWIVVLPKDHWLKRAIFQCISDVCKPIRRLSHVREQLQQLEDCPQIKSLSVGAIDLGSGSVKVTVQVEPKLFYQVLGEATGLHVNSEEELIPLMAKLAQTQRDYEKIRGAMEEVQATGYGIVMPSLEELHLEEPEIVKQGGRYGVRLKASAPSIHMMRADITTEVSPIVGSEKQSEELVKYLLKEFEEDPVKIWDSNIFGKSLHELVNEGLHNKLYRMPSDARMRLQETIERIINEGCNGLICIIL
ncbi:MAG: stage IV sporulation protein A [Oscillospiraceae bacterium]|nr:stage IV sporulation protein A [Oscillospiraceae bacterium]